MEALDGIKFTRTKCVKGVQFQLGQRVHSLTNYFGHDSHYNLSPSFNILSNYGILFKSTNNLRPVQEIYFENTFKTSNMLTFPSTILKEKYANSTPTRVNNNKLNKNKHNINFQIIVP